jgi:SEC-C motif domain protein
LTQKNTCPCGGSSYSSCCQPFHEGDQVAPTPEKLMRSRYSAYAMELEPYLLSTWHPDTRPDEPLFLEETPTKWVELKIKQSQINDDLVSGIVEFVAIFKVNGKAHRIHEISEFVKENGRWFYVDGQFPDIK